MNPAYSMIALTIAGVAVLYGVSAAQRDRAFENVSVLRAQRSSSWTRAASRGRG
jgi:hypothetical protein